MTKLYGLHSALHIIFALALVLLPSLSNASERQSEFYKIIGKHASGRSVAETKDGYIIAGGAPDKAGRCCLGWVIKIDKSGNKLWERTLGENYDDYNFVKTAVIGSKVVLAGATDVYYQPEWHAGRFSAAKVWALKLTEDGAIEWEKRLRSRAGITDENADVFPAVLATDVKAVNGDKTIIAGFQEIGAFHVPAVWMLDAKGEVVWVKSIDVERGQSISADRVYPLQDGDFVIAGRFADYNNDSLGAWLARIGPEGAVRWERVIETEKGGDGEGLSRSIAITESGDGVIVGVGKGYLKLDRADNAGSIKSATFISSKSSVWLNKLKKNGDLEWRKKIEAPDACEINGLWTINMQDDGIVAAGETCKDEGEKIWAATLSASGRFKSMKEMLPVKGANVQQIIPSGDGGLTAVGVLYEKETNSPATWIYRTKFNSDN
ncbi:MAG: hypothetical protein HZB22_08095 [Deltaproteobacteria bacterium]|nr:hypothetical protein [Deltaproteobacteria bacterium]